jgi:hypothetical protein
MRRATYGILALLIVGGVACGTDDTPALRRGTSGIRRPWGKYLRSRGRRRHERRPGNGMDGRVEEAASEDDVTPGPRLRRPARDPNVGA